MDKKNKSGNPSNWTEMMDAKEYCPINKRFPSKPIGKAMRDTQLIFLNWFHAILYPHFTLSSIETLDLHRKESINGTI